MSTGHFQSLWNSLGQGTPHPLYAWSRSRAHSTWLGGMGSMPAAVDDFLIDEFAAFAVLGQVFLLVADEGAGDGLGVQVGDVP